MRMFVHLEPASQALNRLVEEQHPNVIHVYGDEAQIVKALTNNASITDNEVYIMDPMGSVMMRFTHDQPNKDLLKDIKRLLKASQIG
jgi:cytochrome oxidase Cu insertion factor (SCO1/SenC/PrrC family)